MEKVIYCTESEKKEKKDLAYYFLFALLSFLITCNSSTILLKEAFLNPDSYSYRYMGMLMAKGGLPYVDGFDNKGPFIYFLNYLGYCINKQYGVWLLELIFVFLFLVVAYRFSLRFLKGFTAFMAVIFSVSSLNSFFVGNMNEEYSLVFLTLGLLIFVDYSLFDNKSLLRIFICGACFGAVLLFKPNMIILWPFFCLYVVFDYLIKRHAFPAKFSFMFLAGFVTSIAPFMIWMLLKGVFTEYWKDCFVSNMAMTGGLFSGASLFDTTKSLFFTSMMEVHIFILLFLILKKKNVVFNLVYIAFMLVNLVMTCLSCIPYSHYGMILIPSFIYPVCAIVNYLSDTVLRNKKTTVNYLLAVLSVMFFVFLISNFFDFVKEVSSGNKPDRNKEQVISLILENTNENDRILVLGFRCSDYVLSDRLASTKFYYQLSNVHYADGDDVMIEDINSSLPKMVIVENENDFGDWFEYYEMYELIDMQNDVWLLKDEYTP